MSFEILAYILAFTVFGSIISLVGGILLLYWRKAMLKKSMLYMVSFAIGTLLSAAFFDLIPESIELASAEFTLFWVFGGIVAFYLFESFIRWHFCQEIIHHHHKGHKHIHAHPYGYLLTAGDAIHNFVDGVIIAASFLVSIPLGVITAIAVFFHEIPQELADFSVLLHAKFPPKKVLFYNVASALTAILGALATYLFAPAIKDLIPGLTAFAAGGFIYIALTDLVPETHEMDVKKHLHDVLAKVFFLLLGIAVIYFLGQFLAA